MNASAKEDELSPEELTALLEGFMPDIPGYRVMRRIGKGGMAQVYLGVQVSLDRQVAIKVMAPSALTDEVSKQRFEHEARTIAKLEHPCIVGIHEVGRTPQGLLYYVLPYLAKGHLAQRDFSHDEDRVIEVLRAVLSALEYAHARGIVHRDVKAENILFDNADRPLLTDFGIALSKRDATRITTAGLALGSGGYMAPEQARGEAVDGRADLYSVGVLAFELLSGHLPYQHGDGLALALMHAQDPIPRLPPKYKHWQAFVDKAMAKAADNRFRNAQQMSSSLEAIALNRMMPARRATDGRKPAWLIPALAAGAGIALVAGIAWWFSGGDQQPDFYTGEDAPPAASAPPSPTAAASGDATSAAPAPPADAPPSETAATTAAPTPPAAAAAAATPGEGVPGPAGAVGVSAVSSAGMFANVVASVASVSLDYDPATPGARELAAARRQLAADRLSVPPGDNAAESLIAAKGIGVDAKTFEALADQLLKAFGGKLLAAVSAGQDDNARALHERARRFAREAGRERSVAWTTVLNSLHAPIIRRLENAVRAQDGAALTATKSLATALALDTKALEPSWSRAIVQPKAGDALRGDGPAMVLATVPTATRAGLAVMREEVSRSEYAAFVSATRRGNSRCVNRLAALFGGSRSWSSPGFAQTGAHPVVCISWADANAYAQWLSQTTGMRYRLPTASEWNRIAGYSPSGDRCRAGALDCDSRKGTESGGRFAASPLGLHDVLGNASEWLSDNSGGRRLAAGASWRDPPARANFTGTSQQPADRGFDDIGFRLVREVSLQELGGR